MKLFQSEQTHDKKKKKSDKTIFHKIGEKKMNVIAPYKDNVKRFFNYVLKQTQTAQYSNYAIA